MFLGSIVISIIGVIIIAVCAYFYSNSQEEVKKHTGLVVAFIAFGVVLIIVGVFGAISTCCSKVWPIRIYCIILVLVSLLLLIVGAVAFMYSDTVYDSAVDTLKEYCDVADDKYLNESKCAEEIESVLSYLCENGSRVSALKEGQTADAVCSDDEKHELKDYCQCPLSELKGTKWDSISDSVVTEIAAMAKGNYKLVGGVGIGAAIFLIFMTVATFISCCCGRKSKPDADSDPNQVLVAM